MTQYRQIVGMDNAIKVVERLQDHSFIPIDPKNADYMQMKKDLLSGSELQDPTGAVIDGKAWAGTLP